MDLIKLDYKDFTIEAVNRIGKSLALSPPASSALLLPM